MGNHDDTELVWGGSEREIVRELLREDGFPTTDRVVDFIWSSCHGNPFNASQLYRIFQVGVGDDVELFIEQRDAERKGTA